MAELLWGQVYLNQTYAGILRQEPGERCSFTYDPSFLNAKHPAIAFTLPPQEQPHISQQGLHPFFDNLVAEGWLEEAQTRLLGKRQASRFELLLAFGLDCAGAVSIHDPTPAAINQLKIDKTDPKELALLKGRASLSGIQPKITLVREKNKFRPARAGETSTHIAKFPSARHPDLVLNEYLTMHGFQTLLPQDPVAEVTIDTINTVAGAGDALIVKRFDRAPDGSRLHFEEFNQLLAHPSAAKYAGSYKQMADFIRTTPNCLPAEIYRLYLRILAGLLLGNTDMHLKNFAMFHTPEGFRLTPSYDQLAAALYQYKSLALAIGTATDLSWPSLKAKSLIRLGKDFALTNEAIQMAHDSLAAKKDAALDNINENSLGSTTLKNNLIQRVKKKMERNLQLDWRGLVEEAIKRRKSLKLTQKQLAVLAGVSGPTVNRFEQNDANITLNSAFAILSQLGLLAQNSQHR